MEGFGDGSKVSMIIQFGRTMNIKKDICTILLGTILSRLYEFNDFACIKGPRGWNIASGCIARTFLIDNIQYSYLQEAQYTMRFNVSHYPS